MPIRIYNFIRHPYLLLFLVPIILFSPVIFSGKVLFWGTQITQFIPWWQKAVEILAEGELPLWNPLNGMGAPLLANYQSALLYPPVWLLLVLGAVGGSAWVAWGLALVLSFHLGWAGFGMARLVKAMGWGMLSQVVSGLAFGISGYLVARSHFPSIIFAAAWLPWILLATYQLISNPRYHRYVLQLALWVGMLLLTGHAQTAWHILILAGVWMLYWIWAKEGTHQKLPVLGWFSIAVLIGFFLALAQLLPTLEYLLQSQRAAEVDYEFAVAYSFWPWRILTLIIPNLFGTPAAGNYAGYAAYWEDAIYIGLLPIMLALQAILSRSRTNSEQKLKWFLLLLAAVAFLLALGDNTPVFPWLYHYVPGFDMFQAPTRFSIWAVFSLSFLAGMGAESWQHPEGRRLYWSRLGVAAAVAIALGAGMALVLRSFSGESFAEIPETYISAFALLSFLGVISGVVNLRVPIEKENQEASAWTYAVFFVISLDLLIAAWGLNPGEDASIYQRIPHHDISLGELDRDGNRLYISIEEERVLKFERFFSFETFALNEDWINIRSAVLPNTNLLENIPSTNNFDPLVPGRFHDWMEMLENAPPLGKQAMLARMAVAWYVHPDPDSPNGIWFEPVISEPRIRWVPCARDVDSAQAALDLIVDSQLNASEWVMHLAETPSENTPCDLIGTAEIEIVQEMNNQLVVEVQSERDGWLVVADVWYPGWRASLDGSPIEILIADTVFRSVPVPAGNHTIEFEYRPASFYLGVVLSLAAWITLFWVWRRQS